MLDGIAQGMLQFSRYFTKVTVFKKPIESFPSGRIAARRVVQPVAQHFITAILLIHSLTPRGQLLPGHD